MNSSFQQFHGRIIQTLANKSQPAGRYEAQWNGTDVTGKQVSACMYFARFQSGDYSQVVKMVYLK